MSAKIELVVIGGSAGSLDVIFDIVPALGSSLAPIIIVLHRKRSNRSPLAGVLQARTSLLVKEADEKEEILPGCIYIAPPDYHLLIEQDRTFSLDCSEKINYSRPAIDATFETAGEIYGPGLAAILLSGANADGMKGLVAVKKYGGLTVAQDPDTARSPYMPQKAIKANAATHVLRPDEIAEFINRIAGRHAREARP